MTYTESQIRSLCGYYPDILLYKTSGIFILLNHPLFDTRYITWLFPVSNKRYKIHAMADHFIFTNKIISCEYSMLSSYNPQLNYDYTFSYQPNNLNEYLKYFHQQLPIMEKEYKKFCMECNLDKINGDFV